jgi:hypothetical protein
MRAAPAPRSAPASGRAASRATRSMTSPSPPAWRSRGRHPRAPGWQSQSLYRLLPCDGRGILATCDAAGSDRRHRTSHGSRPQWAAASIRDLVSERCARLRLDAPAFPSLSACIQGQTFGTFMNSSRAPPRRTICAPNAGQSTALVAHPTQACCARALSAWGSKLTVDPSSAPKVKRTKSFIFFTI